MAQRLKNKKVLFLALGRAGVASSRTRVYGYLPYLRALGYRCRVRAYSLSVYHRALMGGRETFFLKLINKIYGWWVLLCFVPMAACAEVIFIQRVLLPRWAFKIIKAVNPAVIFDFDDAIYLRNRHACRLNYILRNAACVITTQSRFNREYASAFSRRLEVLTTPVDTGRYFPAQGKTGGAVTIGWIGTPETSVYLLGMRDVFCGLAKKFPFLKFEFIGARQFELSGANASFRDWRLDTELGHLRNFDIGIMPLSDDPWSRNKYYKLLQYFALGIPAVASSVGVCKDIIEDGLNGFLARDAEEWVSKLSLLVDDPQLRQRMGNRARIIALEQYSYEANTPRLTAALEGASG